MVLPSGRKWEKMFFGSFEHSLDEKNRLVIPSKMREEAGKSLFVMKGYDGAIAIYKQDTFEKLMEKINSLPFEKRQARDYARAMLATVSELDIDKAGRVQIPMALITRYNITKEVVVLGAGDHIEVWSKLAYEQYSKSIDENFEDNAESLIKLDK